MRQRHNPNSRGRHGAAPRHSRRWLSLAGVLALLGAVVAVGSATSVHTALADVASPHRDTGYYDGNGAGSWDGGYAGMSGVSGSQEWFCVTVGGGEPDAFGPYSYALAGGMSSNGATLSTAQLAWAYQRYGHDGNNDNGAALWQLTEENINNDALPVSYLTASELTAYTNIVTQARRYGGPYTLTVNGLPSNATDPNFTSTYAAYVHVSGPGGSISGVAVALSATGASIWASATTDSSGDAWFNVRPTNQNFTVSARISDPADLIRADAQGTTPSTSQSIVSYGNVTHSATAKGSVDPTVTASLVKLTVGNPTPQQATFNVVDDTVGATLPNSPITTNAGSPTPLSYITPGHRYTFTETVAPPGAYIPADPNFVVTVPTTAGNGYQITLTDPKMPVLGVATVASPAQTTVRTGVPLADAVTVTGDDGENGTITATLHGPVTPAAGATDCTGITAAQWAAAATRRYTASVVGSTNGGNGTYTVTSTPVTALGCYGWSEVVTVTPSGASTTSAATATGESTLVTAPSPAIATQANYQLTPTGNALADAVTVTGDDGENGTITATLHGPATPAAGATDCTGITAAQWAAAATQTFTTPVNGASNNGNATYTVQGPVPSASGCYGWSEHLALTPSGATADSPATAPQESTLVTTPTAITQASEQFGLVGDRVHDTVTMSGTTSTPAPPTVSGSGVSCGTASYSGPMASYPPTAPRCGVATLVVVTYFMPYQSTAQVCSQVTTAQWQSYIAANPTSAPVRVDVFGINHDGQVQSSDYTVTRPGCVTYEEAWQLGQLSNPAATPPTTNSNPSVVLSQPGAANEVTSIVAPTVTTKMSVPTGTSPTTMQLYDVADVRNTHGAPVIVHDVLLGPADPATGQSGCATAQFDPKAKPFRSFNDIAVTADGSYRTNEVTVPRTTKTQCYVGYESLSIPAFGADGQAVANSSRGAYTGPLGETAELALVAPLKSGGVTSGGNNRIDTGRPGPGSGPDLPLVIGGIALLTALAAICGAVAVRRRGNR